MPVAATFAFLDQEEQDADSSSSSNEAPLQHVAELDTLVTVVDGQRFVKDVLGSELLQDQGLQADAEDERTVAELLIEQVTTPMPPAGPLWPPLVAHACMLGGRLAGSTHSKAAGNHKNGVKALCICHRPLKLASTLQQGHDVPVLLGLSLCSCAAAAAAVAAGPAAVACAQVEFANVLILNKTDLITQQEQQQLLAVLKTLNPSAKMFTTQHCSVPIAAILHTHSFDWEAAQASPGWVQAISRFEQQHGHHGHHDHHHDHDHSEVTKYGISSFVYYAQRPFHPGRLLDQALSRTWQGVLRSKGFYWLATRHDVMGLWQSAGGAWQGEPRCVVSC